MDKTDALTKKIWDYMHMHHVLEKADCILVLGSSDNAPAYRACDLYFQGYAPIIIFSGKYGEIKKDKPEAEMYKDIALERGVPEKDIFVENKSTNTGENIIFSKELIEKNNIPCTKIIVVQKPYMERRTYTTFKKNWPEPKIFVTSQNISYEDYIKDNPHYTKEEIINRIVGDFQRIKEYPKLGFQIEQEIPEDIWQFGQELVVMGYDKYTLKK